MKRRLTTIMVGDIVGFSSLMEADEEGTARRIRSFWSNAHDEVTKAEGRLFKTMGDAVLAEFPSPVNALRCAVQLRNALDRGEAPGDALQMRFGLHLADVMVEGDDLIGDGVNIAARIQQSAEPGAIDISAALFDQVRRTTQFEFDDLGERAFKNIAGPVRIFRVRDDGANAPDRAQPVPLELNVAPEFAGLGVEFSMPEKPSLIVLPFKDLSANGAVAHFAEGIRIDVQTSLVKISGLFVVAAGSAAIYSDRDVRAEQVSSEMGVQYVLTGSVRGNAERLRVTTQLEDGTSGEIVWSERYDRVVGDDFLVQDEIVEKIVTSLDVALVGGEQARVWRKTLRDPRALELYYRGLQLLITFDQQSVAAARQVFEKVTEISPDVTLGPTCVAFCHYWDATMGWSANPDGALTEAEVWAERAAAMEDADGQAHAILAHVKLLRGKHEDALRIADEAIRIRPLCAMTNALSGNVLLYCGRPLDAVERLKSAIRAAPVYASWWVEILASAYRDAGKYRLAIAAATELLRKSPDHVNGRLVLASALAAEGKLAEARKHAERILTDNPDFSLSRYATQHPYREAASLQAQLQTLRKSGLPD